MSKAIRFICKDGKWNNSKNWSRGRVPMERDSVIIPKGCKATMDCNILCESLISHGGFDMTNECHTLTLRKNFKVLGELYVPQKVYDGFKELFKLKGTEYTERIERKVREKK